MVKGSSRLSLMSELPGGKKSPNREYKRGKQPPTETPVKILMTKNCQNCVTKIVKREGTWPIMATANRRFLLDTRSAYHPTSMAEGAPTAKKAALM